VLDGVMSAVSAFPVLVACGACGNVHDLLFMLGSTFGLTALIALGQYARDRVRERLGYRRAPLIAIEDAICASDALCRPGDPTSTPAKMAMESRSC
jgi:hypothetical protein